VSPGPHPVRAGNRHRGVDQASGPHVPAPMPTAGPGGRSHAAAAVSFSVGVEIDGVETGASRLGFGELEEGSSKPGPAMARMNRDVVDREPFVGNGEDDDPHDGAVVFGDGSLTAADDLGVVRRSSGQAGSRYARRSARTRCRRVQPPSKHPAPLPTGTVGPPAARARPCCSPPVGCGPRIHPGHRSAISARPESPRRGLAVVGAPAPARCSDEAVDGFNEYDPRRTPGSSRGGTAPANLAAMVQSEGLGETGRSRTTCWNCRA
jgi:hypothetical protein